MGHLAGKDLYRRLGTTIDAVVMRAPWSERLYAVLKQLYSEEDAALVARMPYGFSGQDRLCRATGLEAATLQLHLDDLSHRGLVLDIEVENRRYYAPSPLVIGVFELTMMRTGGVDHVAMARLFHEYVAEGGIFAANFGAGQRVSLLRSLPHEGTVVPEDHVEVLDYEKATSIVENTERFAVGTCSCRHEKHHLGTKTCEVPLEGCTMLGRVDSMISHGFAREISKTEMLELLARSRELGLVLNIDNVRRNASFLCHCCSCCCNFLSGITQHGYTNAVVTSSYVAVPDDSLCKGCISCSESCPVKAVTRIADPDPRFRKFGRPRVDEAACLGCGVCALRCQASAMKLRRRKQKVLHPETVFERVILQSLECGTLQNQLFDDPEKKTHAFLRALLGGFFRLPPVKQALMSEVLRSRFLAAMRHGAVALGKGGFVDL